MRRPLLALLCCLAAGCASEVPTEFHTLIAPAPSLPNVPASGLRFRIETPVHVPAQVDQPQVVLRRADGSLQVLEQQRWVAPLADEWRDALSQRIALQLGALDVSRLRPAPGAAPYVLQLELLRFDSAPGAQAFEHARFSVQRPGEETPALTCEVVGAEAAGAGVAAVAAAHRQVLARLGDAIAATIQGLQRGGRAACPSPGS
jgi:hypothetical protein